MGGPAGLQIQGTLNANANPVTINIASITGTGDYALIDYNNISSGTLSANGRSAQPMTHGCR
jgi:hypothetical protein